ncbi:diacylglycerol kinase family enzyme [Brevundimonas bullata]|uniref:Diacylglycerol kinase family enzyme n=1 Tax=Brevundimonas bullata TaxID=13160 RepID=A0A7W7N359_9CAUL|nr:diacylglycerol kinase family protein [Brevundimonas bullata]MBB4796907.1 diacylglycerol kinase family enzyme [Brevundimonas bullata]MBB6381866.1 diacylglycerol kinase family enzyme [Brevundimonas bullata]
MTDAPAPIDPPVAPRLTPHVSMKRVTILVNPLSGGVGPQAAAEAEAILSVYDFEATVTTLEGPRIADQIGEALAAKPDVLFVLAGDGTARSVAARAGAKGPLIAPLPGGTMNMLPKALYGTADWKLTLRLALEDGAPQVVSGGEVEGEAFYCAAILGAPALWAPAREAMRTGKLKLAWLYGRRALKRAFSGHIRFSLDGGDRRRAEALVLISPMISKVMDEPVGLEAAAMTPSDAAQAFALAARAVFDDWRHDPNVMTQPARRITVSARSKIPAVIDGEPMLLGRNATVVFLPRAFMALAPLPPAAEGSI